MPRSCWGIPEQRESDPIMEMTVGQIAQLVGGIVEGDASVRVCGVNSLAEATEADLTFARSPQYFSELLKSRAAAALAPQSVPDAPMPIIRVDQPDVAFLSIVQHMAPPITHPSPGVHSSACIDATAQIGEEVTIGAHVSIAANAQIGDHVIIYPGVYVGARCRVGDNTILYPNVVLREDTVLGKRCIIHAGACIGSDGFGFAPIGGSWHKIPQIGTVSIGDDVEIGSNTTVDRATFGTTTIGSGTKIDNLVQIGHNVQLGKHCAIAGKAGVSGSAQIGDHVSIGADAGLAGHITIGKGTTIGGRAGVTRSIGEGQVVSGFPAIDHALQRRVLVAQQKLPELLRRVRELERTIEALKDAQGNETTNNR